MSSESDSWSSSACCVTDDAVKHEVHAMNVTVTPGQILISDDLMWDLNIYVFILLCGSVSIFGTLSNTCNMIIFFKLDFKDSMSVCLFALSLTDFLVCCIVMIGRACPIWDIFYHGEGVDPMALLYAGPAWLADSLFLCSGWILTFLSLERCVCVMFPFKVKQIFTRNRAIVAVVLIHLITASSYIPIYMSHWLEWVSEDTKVANETRVIHRLAILFSENRREIQSTVAMINSTVIPVPSLILTMGSVLWMIYGLNASSKLRHSMTSHKNTEKEGQKTDSQLTLKTRRLVKVVLFLAIIFIFLSIPRILAKSINTIFPEVNEGGRGRNLNNFVWQLARFSACLNGSMNIFIYLKINSAYQDKFREVFSTGKVL